MSTQGPFPPAAATNDGTLGAGLAWLGLPANVRSAGGGYSAPPTSLRPHGQTLLLVATGFGFQAPDGALDVTVTFDVSRRKINAARVADLAVRLVLGGVIQAEEHALPGDWPGSFATASYAFGGLAAEQVNDPGFGIALAAKNYSDDLGGDSAGLPVGVPCVDLIQASCECP